MLKFAAHVPIHRSLFTIGLENKRENPVWKELGLYPVNNHLHNYSPPNIFTDKFQESVGLHIFCITISVEIKIISYCFLQRGKIFKITCRQSKYMRTRLRISCVPSSHCVKKDFHRCKHECGQRVYKIKNILKYFLSNVESGFKMHRGYFSLLIPFLSCGKHRCLAYHRKEDRNYSDLCLFRVIFIICEYFVFAFRN